MIEQKNGLFSLFADSFQLFTDVLFSFARV